MDFSNGFLSGLKTHSRARKNSRLRSSPRCNRPFCDWDGHPLTAHLWRATLRQAMGTVAKSTHSKIAARSEKFWAVASWVLDKCVVSYELKRRRMQMDDTEKRTLRPIVLSAWLLGVTLVYFFPNVWVGLLVGFFLGYDVRDSRKERS